MECEVTVPIIVVQMEVLSRKFQKFVVDILLGTAKDGYSAKKRISVERF